MAQRHKPAGSTLRESVLGFAVACANGFSCTGAGQISLSSVTLTASETTGPTLSAEGPGNLWDQSRSGESIWNPPGDAWPLTLAASDASGVCSLSAVIGAHKLLGPSSLPNTTAWQQCPEPTWTPTDGASVDTRAYVPGDGALPLTINATNAAGVITSAAETLRVDNDPVTVLLSTSNDRTIWTNHAVTVFAAASAGPSGIGGTNCSIGNGNPQPYPFRGLTVDGDGVHTILCTAWNNAVGPQGQPNSTDQLHRRQDRRGATVDWLRAAEPGRPNRPYRRCQRQRIWGGDRHDRDGAGGDQQLGRACRRASTADSWLSHFDDARHFWAVRFQGDLVRQRRQLCHDDERA